MTVNQLQWFFDLSYTFEVWKIFFHKFFFHFQQIGLFQQKQKIPPAHVSAERMLNCIKDTARYSIDELWCVFCFENISTGVHLHAIAVLLSISHSSRTCHALIIRRKNARNG